MGKMRLNKNNKIALALVATAVLLIAISATNSQMATSVVRPPPQEIAVNFSVNPGSDTVVVEKGKSASVPLNVEAPINATMTLQLRVASEHGNADPEKLQSVLSNANVALSAQDIATGKATDLGNGRALRSAGMLTLNPAGTLATGTYTVAIEAVQQADGKLADGLVSGTIVTVVVK
jgi:hypothetical protein